MDMVLNGISAVCIVLGIFLGITGALGIYRLPNFFTRLHAASVTDSGCAFLILTGLMFQSGLTVPTIKLCFILVFLLITSPTATHALAKTALDCGAEPTPYPYGKR